MCLALFVELHAISATFQARPAANAGQVPWFLGYWPNRLVFFCKLAGADLNRALLWKSSFNQDSRQIIWNLPWRTKSALLFGISHFTAHPYSSAPSLWSTVAVRFLLSVRLIPFFLYRYICYSFSCSTTPYHVFSHQSPILTLPVGVSLLPCELPSRAQQWKLFGWYFGINTQQHHQILHFKRPNWCIQPRRG